MFIVLITVFGVLCLDFPEYNKLNSLEVNINLFNISLIGLRVTLNKFLWISIWAMSLLYKFIVIKLCQIFTFNISNCVSAKSIFFFVLSYIFHLNSRIFFYVFIYILYLCVTMFSINLECFMIIKMVYSEKLNK